MAARRRCSMRRSREFERVLIRAALKRTQGHRQDAAKLLGWGRNTLTRKLKELGMNGADAAGRVVARAANPVRFRAA